MQYTIMMLTILAGTVWIQNPWMFGFVIILWVYNIIMTSPIKEHRQRMESFGLSQWDQLEHNQPIIDYMQSTSYKIYTFIAIISMLSLIGYFIFLAFGVDLLS